MDILPHVTRTNEQFGSAQLLERGRNLMFEEEKAAISVLSKLMGLSFVS